MKKLSPLALACALFFPACEQNRQLAGEVFIVTAGHESVKLGLVEVGVFDADKVSAVISETKAKISPEMEKMNVVVPKLQELRDAAEKQWKAGVQGPYKQEAILRLSNRRVAAESLCTEALDHLTYLQSSAMFFEKLPPAFLAVKTDADGRFTINLPNRAVVLGAVASRRLPLGDTEFYYWLVRVDRDTDKIMLSNDNLMSAADRHSVAWASEPLGKMGGSAEALAERGEKLRGEMIAASDPAVPTPKPIVTKVAPAMAPTPALDSLPPFVTLKQPIKVRIAYGEVTLQAGTKLQVISREGATLSAQFGNDKVQVPVSATDLR